MTPRMFASAMVLAASLASAVDASAETFRQNEIGYRVRPDGTVVVHRSECRGCIVYRRERAGPTFIPRPVVDYRQSLPVYQPPIYAHPPQVTPVDRRRQRSGAYAVTGTPGYRYQHEPLRQQPAWYPGGGSDARVIRLTDPPGPRRP
ncbi:hypothetical protein E8L99_15565 [Phreatobacter aquaticus]|uniref:Uncharacterized protein n=1 Tax=Phreatobacter aquaticus TaxID=2570229 RepID=A0A4D7QQ90_9HYPH|nr:hypothetical protein [Phreatobacter aquaticus]QCK87077.1 hypothetical protein E8L99_15565 [Phreatobacter aquaticus]